MNCIHYKHKGLMCIRSITKVWIVLSTSTKVWCVQDPTRRSELYSIQTQRSDVCKVRQKCLHILNTNTESWFAQAPTQRSDTGPRQDPLTTVLRCLSFNVQTQRFAPRNKSQTQNTKWSCCKLTCPLVVHRGRGILNNYFTTWALSPPPPLTKKKKKKKTFELNNSPK